MKVLHVYRTYFPDPPGGAQEAIRQICLGTQALGVENTIFTLSPKPTPHIIMRPEAKVVRCRSWAAPASCDLGAVDALRAFRELAHEADVIHYLFPWPYADILHLFMAKKPSILTYVSDVVRQKWLGALYAPLMWHTLNTMDALVSNAPTYAQTSPILSKPSIRKKITQIPLGIDENSYDVTADDSIFERLSLKREEPFMLFIGVLRYYKGVHFLLDACRDVLGRVVIAGDGPEMATLKHQAATLNLHNVTFAGRVTEGEKIALLKACRGLVLPSHLRSEAYGMVLVEASIFSKPMVSCEIGTGTSFVNMDGETGLVVPPQAPGALAAAINLLLKDAAQAQQFGLAARQRYEKHFSGHALGKAYKKLYDKVIEAHQL